MRDQWRGDRRTWPVRPETPAELPVRLTLATGLTVTGIIVGALATVLLTSDGVHIAGIFGGSGGVLQNTDPAIRRAAGGSATQEESRPGGLLGLFAPAPKERFTVLILGSDRRTASKSGNSDTLMLATLDPAGKTIGLLSIPRDLNVPIHLPNGTVETTRINAAHGYGGPALAKSTIESLFGVKIHKTLAVDMSVFPDLVDTLGGVAVNPPKELAEVFLPQGAGGPKVPVKFPAGPQRLNGEQALYYVRMRHVDSDIGRMGRQQEVLMGLQQQATQLNVLPRLPELWGQFQSAVKTDMTLMDIVGLAPAALGIPRDQIAHTLIGWNHVNAVENEKGWRVLEPNWPAIRVEVSRVFYDIRARAAVGRVEIVNRSGTPGLGDTAALALRRQGIAQVTVRDEAAVGPASSVRTATKRLSGANQVAGVLGLRAVPDAAAGDTITVVLGKGYRG